VLASPLESKVDDGAERERRAAGDEVENELHR
jgi:hypothetical protein